jgi:hypothetical protein
VNQRRSAQHEMEQSVIRLFARRFRGYDNFTAFYGRGAAVANGSPAANRNESAPAARPMPHPKTPEPELGASDDRSEAPREVSRDPSKGTSPKALLFAWWCSVCHRREPFTLEDLVRFARDGWPVCCGQTVLGYSPAKPAEQQKEDEGG